MRVYDFIWLPDVVEKLEAKHQVTTDEVEEVFFNQPRFRFMEKGRVQGEDMFSALGQTDAGRYLVVLFIFKPRDIALSISARDMNAGERKRYGRK